MDKEKRPWKDGKWLAGMGILFFILIVWFLGSYPSAGTEDRRIQVREIGEPQPGCEPSLAVGCRPA